MKPHMTLFKSLLWIILFACIHLFIGCSYYRVNSIASLNEPQTKEQFNQLLGEKKYFIIHWQENTLHLDSLEVDFNKQVITGIIHPVDTAHTVYINNEKLKQPPKYKPSKDSSKVLEEVHLYLTIAPYKENHNEVSIPFNAVSRMDIVEQDVGRTEASYIFGTLGVIASVVAVIGMIAALTKSSCPLVYAAEDNDFHFKGEIYGGAIAPQLERDDYLPLQSAVENPVNRLLISNELKENQYTNLAALVVVEHAVGTQIFADAQGNYYEIADMQPAVTAILDQSLDQTAELRNLDHQPCFFNDPDQEAVLQQLILTFNKNESVQEGLLVLELKNSLWLDYMYGEFTSLFGSYYNRWKQQQRTISADSLQSWSMHQGIRMQVAVATRNGWSPIAAINTVGPLASRYISIPIDLSQIPGRQLHVKLTSGFMFWEVDQAGFSDALLHDFSAREIIPSTAINENKEDVSNLLSATDQQYLEQAGPGHVTEVTYQLPTCRKERVYSTFLHARGWYDHIRSYSGTPDIKYLQTFRSPGAFTRFSQQRYLQLYPNNFIASGK